MTTVFCSLSASARSDLVSQISIQVFIDCHFILGTGKNRHIYQHDQPSFAFLLTYMVAKAVRTALRKLFTMARGFDARKAASSSIRSGSRKETSESAECCIPANPKTSLSIPPS
jgi:hypothetical protein